MKLPLPSTSVLALVISAAVPAAHAAGGSAAPIASSGLAFAAKDGLVSFAADDGLEAAFASPPRSAQPMTWWHWMNGNITREGITADLEAMARVGLVGAQIFNVANKAAVNIPAGPVDYLSSAWLDLLEHAVNEAERLGLTLGLHNSPGWSGSGGPWVKPEHSMKTVIWSEVNTTGPTAAPLALPQPRAAMGFYRDIAIVAFPTPAGRPPRIPAPEGAAAHADTPPARIDFDRVTAESIVPRERVHILPDRMAADGRLDWTPPTGAWTVLRFGYTTNGKMNRPAAPSATGLESDKMSRASLDHFWAGGIQPIIDRLGPRAGRALQAVLVDSFEAGRQNWTDLMPAEFRRRRGYDIAPFLPILAGWVIGSVDETQRFEWDLNRTIADLYAVNFYDYFAEKCRAAGLLFACEPYGNGGFEFGAVAAQADLVLGEFWVNRGIHASPKLASSTAHTFGHRIVAAESFTAQPEHGRWQNHPGRIKGIGDRMWCEGLNRFVFHSYPHQPWTEKFPGMTMGMWGTHFGRTNTWWEQSPAWIRYLSRSQTLLQAGRPVADVLVFGGEAPHTWTRVDPALRAAGYDYDLVTTPVLPHLRVEGGEIVLPSGGRYRVLELLGPGPLTPGLAGIVRDLVRAGAVVVASRPTGSPSLTGWPQADRTVEAIANEVWGPASKEAGHRVCGEGKIHWGRSALEVLRELDFPPDFAPAAADPELFFIHRSSGTTDLYFVSNQAAVAKTVACDFRVTSREPEFWDPLSGEHRPAGLWRAGARTTRVTLSLPAGGSVFVVFRRPVETERPTFVSLLREGRESGASGRPAEIVSADGELRLLAWDDGNFTARLSDGSARAAVVRDVPAALAPTRSWTVEFTPGWGAPARIELARLMDWTQHEESGVRHYSGSATYRTTLDVPAAFLDGADRLELDLGDVHVIADVTLNGRPLGTLWCSPFVADASGAVLAGENSLEIRVTNLWPNRIIGDEALPADVEWEGKALRDWPAWLKEGRPRPSSQRLTFVTWHHWSKDDSLLPSGLLGPVRLRAGRLVELPSRSP